jgi:uncharacterized membrane protein YhaH (DUF805 family)
MTKLSAELRAYGAADEPTRKVIRQTLRRQHRRARERFWLSVLGLIAGFVVALSFLGVSAWLIHSGNGVGGTILGSFDIVALVGVFVYAQPSKDR